MNSSFVLQDQTQSDVGIIRSSHHHSIEKLPLINLGLAFKIHSCPAYYLNYFAFVTNCICQFLNHLDGVALC